MFMIAEAKQLTVTSHVCAVLVLKQPVVSSRVLAEPTIEYKTVLTLLTQRICKLDRMRTPCVHRIAHSQ
jgi:hypothetical protein